MITISIAVVLVVLLVMGVITGGRRRRDSFGYIAPRDLIKYK